MSPQPPVFPGFSEADMKTIREAVKKAESETSAEIVPYIVKTSDDYEEVFWRVFAPLSMISSLLAMYLIEFGYIYSDLGVFEWLSFIFGVAGLIAFLFWKWPVTIRFFAGSTLLTERVTEKATQAFLVEEVFNTRDRTGILIFISVLEHRVLVIGDSGINKKVDSEVWNEVASLVVQGMKSKHPAMGIVNAINRCGQILKDAGVAIKSDDTNELNNNLRTEN